jgi:hypothetical protein
MISTSGGEDLGGGVSVGLTSELQDAKVGFEQRHITLESGTVTTGDSNGLRLIDSAADFEAAGVEPGDWVVNFTDQSWTTVLNVEGTDELLCFSLGGGTDNQFDIGDSYKVLEVIQCEIAGGNLVAVDSGGSSTEALFPTALTNVIRTSASSATQADLEAIQYSSYQNAVWIDTTTSNSGTSYPSGTREYPVNNIPDALTIAGNRGFDTLQIIGDITFTSGHDLSDMIVCGQGMYKSNITINAAANVLNTMFRDAEVDGTLDGGNRLHDCVVGSLTYVNGQIRQCILNGDTMTLGGNATLLDCWSGVPGIATPTIDMGGSGHTLGIRGYSGGIKITNKSGSDSVSIDMISGQCVLDSTVSAGTIVIRGVCVLTNNSTGTTDVNIEGLLSREAITETTWEEVFVDQTNGSSGTAWPLGTRSNPVDNIADAKTIASARGIYKFRLLDGSFTLASAFSGYVFVGEAADLATVNFGGQDVSGSSFHEVTMTGTQNGEVHAHRCKLDSIVSMEGSYIDCIVASNIDCKTGVWTYLWGGQAVGASQFTIDMNGAGKMTLGATGNFLVQNMTNAGAIFLKDGSGAVAGDATNTAGTIMATGLGAWIDAGVGGSVNVTNDLARAVVWDEQMSDHQDSGSMGANQQHGVVSLG